MVNLEKRLKNNLKNHKVDESVTFHACLWHYPLHYFYFCFSTMVAMELFSYMANTKVIVFRTISPLFKI